MAKDPAFLFYPGDWQGGTMYMTHEQKGCYIDLLILQFNVGQFTLAQAKQVLSICFSVAWPMLKQKFVQDGEFYYNEKLRSEIEKRKKFSESRRNNGLGVKSPKKKKEASAKHMHKHMEDVIEDEYKNENKKEGMKGEGFLIPQMWEKWKSANRIYPADKKKDFPALKNIAEFICGQEHIQWMPVDATEIGQILTIWDSMALFIVEDSFFSKYSLEQVFRYIQSISQSFQKNKPKTTKQKIDEADAAVDEYLNR